MSSQIVRYLITPTSDLLTIAADYLYAPPYFHKAHVFQSPEDTHSGMQEADYSQRVKLLFLIDLVDFTGSHPHNSIMPLLNMVIGEPPHTIDLFDKWWHLSRDIPMMSLGTILDDIEMNSTRHFSRTHNMMLDDWLDAMLTLKRDGHQFGD
ncbi:MAG: hypothetical protein ACPG7F_11925 [Aggregatilineales bacterium]